MNSSLEKPSGAPSVPEGAPPRTVTAFLVNRFAWSIATQIQAVAVGWYVYALTDSAFALGMIGLMQFLPTIGLALVAGHIIDHYPRRRVMLISSTVTFLCHAALAGLALSGSSRVTPVFFIVIGIGAARAFTHPAQAALLPTLVSRAAFPRVVAWNATVAQTATILGPAVGGFLYVWGASAAFLTAAIFSAICLIAILVLPAAKSAHAPAALSWSTAMSGIRFIFNHQALLGAV